MLQNSELPFSILKNIYQGNPKTLENGKYSHLRNVVLSKY